MNKQLLFCILLLLYISTVGQTIHHSSLNSLGDNIQTAGYTATASIGDVAPAWQTSGGLISGFTNLLSGNQTRVIYLRLFPEGLFIPEISQLAKVRGTEGFVFSDDISDTLTLEIHSAVPPYPLLLKLHGLSLRTDGFLQTSIPSDLPAEGYLAIRHRNSIETWTSNPVNLNLAEVNWDFTSSAGSAYGSNQKVISGWFCLFTGDVNHDGTIDKNDISAIQAKSSVFMNGYLNEDLNGDGIVDATDTILADNNSALFIVIMRP
jgi:hypothetical protein